jgi:hypothetical protein
MAPLVPIMISLIANVPCRVSDLVLAGDIIPNSGWFPADTTSGNNSSTVLLITNDCASTVDGGGHDGGGT